MTSPDDRAALTDRLMAAIEGECDGLAITNEQSSNILAYLQYGAPMDDVLKDAQRYRKLRNADIDSASKGGVFAGLTPDNVLINGEDLDIAVDLLIDEGLIEGIEHAGYTVPADVLLTDDQILDALACIADDEIMIKNRKSIVDAGRELLALLASQPQPVNRADGDAVPVAIEQRIAGIASKIAETLLGSPSIDDFAFVHGMVKEAIASTEPIYQIRGGQDCAWFDIPPKRFNQVRDEEPYRKTRIVYAAPPASTSADARIIDLVLERVCALFEGMESSERLAPGFVIQKVRALMDPVTAAIGPSEKDLPLIVSEWIDKHPSAAPIASALPAQPTPMSGECFIVKGSGETDLPVVHIVHSLEEARHAVLSLMYSDPADAQDTETLFEDFEDELTDGNYWSIAFEIGGISVERVCLDATPLQSIAPALPAAQPGEKS